MRLALFDLDRTLLPIDSADDCSHFVVRAGGPDAASYAAAGLRAAARGPAAPRCVRAGRLNP